MLWRTLAACLGVPRRYAYYGGPSEWKIMKPVIELKAQIRHIAKSPKGVPVSYDRTWTTPYVLNVLNHENTPSVRGSQGRPRVSADFPGSRFEAWF